MASVLSCFILNMAYVLSAIIPCATKDFQDTGFVCGGNTAFVGLWNLQTVLPPGHKNGGSASIGALKNQWLSFLNATII